MFLTCCNKFNLLVMEILHGLKKHSDENYLNHSFVLVVASAFYFDEGVLMPSFPALACGKRC
jgi:hypothetical protein